LAFIPNNLTPPTLPHHGKSNKKTRDSDKGRKSGTIVGREEEKPRLSLFSEEQ